MEQLARTHKQLGAILRGQRKQLGLTQSALAESLGIRQATISDLESGERDTCLSTVYGVIAGLNLEIVLRTRTRRSIRDFEEVFK